MNKNGIAAVVVVITAVLLVGLWVMRSGQTRPGGRQFDCDRPPDAPANLAYEKNGNVVSGNWTAPAGEEIPSSYVIEAGDAPGASNQGTYVVPATQTSYSRPTPPGTYFVRVHARNACGTSPPSNEITFSVP